MIRYNTIIKQKITDPTLAAAFSPLELLHRARVYKIIATALWLPMGHV
jgi:hypothetical protein